jgi:hypothetical protein
LSSVGGAHRCETKDGIMRRPAEMQLPRVGAGPFGDVECSSGLFGAHVCSPFAPRRAPRWIDRGREFGTWKFAEACNAAMCARSPNNYHASTGQHLDRCRSRTRLTYGTRHPPVGTGGLLRVTGQRPRVGVRTVPCCPAWSGTRRAACCSSLSAVARSVIASVVSASRTGSVPLCMKGRRSVAVRHGES